jgi:hypothetical protein
MQARLASYYNTDKTHVINQVSLPTPYNHGLQQLVILHTAVLSVSFFLVTHYATGKEENLVVSPISCEQLCKR